MPLTELACRSAKGAAKAYKMGDSGGLYLYVTPTGYRSWRWKYRIDRVEKRMIFGPDPEVSLKEARALRDEAARTLRQGADPGAERKKRAADRAAAARSSFEEVARRWHARRLATWSKGHGEKALASLEKDVFQVTSPAR